VGLLAAAVAIVLIGLVGPVSLLLLGVTVIAWRGCPTCWAVGLLGTLADRRVRRGCSNCAAASADETAPSHSVI
jgi:hypothetical protein